MKSRNFAHEERGYDSSDTVDGNNPAPVDVVDIPVFKGGCRISSINTTTRPTSKVNGGSVRFVHKKKHDAFQNAASSGGKMVFSGEKSSI